MPTPTDLDLVRDRIHAAMRERRSCLLFLSAAGLCVQRLSDRVAAGAESAASALSRAVAAEAAALSVPYVAPLENRNVSL